MIILALLIFRQHQFLPFPTDLGNCNVNQLPIFGKIYKGKGTIKCLSHSLQEDSESRPKPYFRFKNLQMLVITFEIKVHPANVVCSHSKICTLNFGEKVEFSVSQVNLSTLIYHYFLFFKYVVNITCKRFQYLLNFTGGGMAGSTENKLSSPLSLFSLCCLPFFQISSC